MKKTQWSCALGSGILLLNFFAGAKHAGADELFARQRLDMVETQIKARGVTDKKTLEAMRLVLRHKFVPPTYLPLAYADRPLPIGEGQTISQPYIVGLMTEQLQLPEDCKVLEIGTGSGYQAAVLSLLCKEVYTIEIIPTLGHEAKRRLKELGYTTVSVKVADGYYGWQEHAPFDGIIVTAAASHLPPPLIEQLKIGGRMLIPLGGIFQVQRLMVVEKDKDGSITSKNILPVQFVPLTGEH